MVPGMISLGPPQLLVAVWRSCDRRLECLPPQATDSDVNHRKALRDTVRDVLHDVLSLLCCSDLDADHQPREELVVLVNDQEHSIGVRLCRVTVRSVICLPCNAVG